MAQTLTAEDIEAIKTAVWSNTRRTLTNVGTVLTSPSIGDPLYLFRDSTIEISIVNLPDLSNAAEIWFTLKDDLTQEDSNSIVQITKVNDLVYLNKAAAITSADGTLTFPTGEDGSEGNVDILISVAAASLLSVYQITPLAWDIKVKYNDNKVQVLQVGSAYILSSATRSI